MEAVQKRKADKLHGRLSGVSADCNGMRKLKHREVAGRAV
jgi:hypothetical protein